VQAPRFSPDGSRLLFAGLGSGALAAAAERDGWLARTLAPRAAAHGIPWNLWVWSPGGQPRQLTRLGQDQIYGAWSPSGERVALVTDMGLYIIERDGTSLARIDALADPRGLAWLRRGPRRGEYSGGQKGWAARHDAGATRRVAPAGSGDLLPAVGMQTGMSTPLRASPAVA
jgi:hypothetical protein